MTKHSKFVIVLPCEGSPFIWGNPIHRTNTEKGKDAVFDACRNALYDGKVGDVEIVNPAYIRLHPAFKNRWIIMNYILREPDVMVFIKDNTEDCMNMAVCGISGDVVVAAPYDAIKRIVNPSALKLVRVADHYDAMGIKRTAPSDTESKFIAAHIFEHDDDEERIKFKKYVKSQGWFIGDWGQIYEMPTGRPDETEGTEYDE